MRGAEVVVFALLVGACGSSGRTSSSAARAGDVRTYSTSVAPTTEPGAPSSDDDVGTAAEAATEPRSEAGPPFSPSTTTVVAATPDGLKSSPGVTAATPSTSPPAISSPEPNKIPSPTTTPATTSTTRPFTTTTTQATTTTTAPPRGSLRVASAQGGPWTFFGGCQYVTVDVRNDSNMNMTEQRYRVTVDQYTYSGTAHTWNGSTQSSWQTKYRTVQPGWPTTETFEVCMNTSMLMRTREDVWKLRAVSTGWRWANGQSGGSIGL